MYIFYTWIHMYITCYPACQTYVFDILMHTILHTIAYLYNITVYTK